MYTVPAFRRNGICKNNVNLLLKVEKKYGCHAFELHVIKLGEIVYTQEGFVHHEEPTLRKFIL
jgi:hypothetical protein